MSHFFAYLPAEADSAPDLGSRAAALLAGFKQVTPCLERHGAGLSLVLAPRARETQAPFAESGEHWLTWTGTWVYQDDRVAAGDGAALLRRYLEVGGQRLGLELQGQFAIFIGDARHLTVITDRGGSLHVFYAALAQGVAVCTSSAVLAALVDDRLDPVGVHEFIATGVIYEQRTLWAKVRKIGAGVLGSLSPEGWCEQRYWRFADLNPETHDLGTAVELLSEGITRSARQLGRAFADPVCDLTGGYDSRALLYGLLKAELAFETTVSGPSTSPDVRVSTEIAQALGLTHNRIDIIEPPTAADLSRALSRTDGEYDIFEYARIAAVHEHLSGRYRISLNGSFGELARGYWWELIWPGVTERAPLSGDLVSRKRFAATPYTAAVFAPEGRLDLRQHLAEALDRTLAEIRQFPKSSQMDALYYYQRMQRWQGRILSSTNQLWPCLSPYSFPQVLVPILETKAQGRIRSTLIRALFERHHPTLARIPLEHGYPPRLCSAATLSQFVPALTGHYGQLVVERLVAKARRFLPGPAAMPLSLGERHPQVFEQLYEGQPLLLESGLFDADQLRAWFDPATTLGGNAWRQWWRMMTVELLLRRLREIRH